MGISTNQQRFVWFFPGYLRLAMLNGTTLTFAQTFLPNATRHYLSCWRKQPAAEANTSQNSLKRAAARWHMLMFMKNDTGTWRITIGVLRGQHWTFMKSHMFVLFKSVLVCFCISHVDRDLILTQSWSPETGYVVPWIHLVMLDVQCSDPFNRLCKHL